MKRVTRTLMAFCASLAFVLPAAARATPQMSRVQADTAFLYSTAQEIEIYRQDYGRYPLSLDELKAPKYHVNKDLDQKLPRYSLSADGKGFDLVFSGPDGNFGTADDIRYDPAKRADNALPMYGGTTVVKTPFQMESDEKFIQKGVENSGTRERACLEVLKIGWAVLQQGDALNAMKRFNQAWLLDPSNPDVFKGFAAVLRKQGKIADADTYESMAQEKSKGRR